MKLLRSLLPEILGVIFSIVVLAFAYLIFSFILQLTNSDIFFKVINDMNATSISVSVAVVLFLIKEFLEYIRKFKARVRKTKALKTIISEEIELNHWTWLKVKGLAETVQSQPSNTKYSIIKSTSGTERFEFYKQEGGGGGQSFPKVYENLINKLITDIAELDKDFYIAAINYTKALAELKHLRAGAYDFIHETQQGKHDAEGFVEYALDELPEIYSMMDKFYQVCSGSKLNTHRMR